MFPETEYRLVDLGEGRRLERWAGVLVDRPIGAPDAVRDKLAGPWRRADLVFEVTEKNRGGWRIHNPPPDEWSVCPMDDLTLELRPNDFGHLGVFPEHAITWKWITSVCRTGANVLNLFAHTGGATLAAARGGAVVAHVDSAPSMKRWGRRNAELSGLDDAAIRWVTEDAQKFAERELRRGRKYDAIILDPPTFGRGPTKEIWRIDDSLGPLLATCRELLSPQPAFALLTCHTPGYTPERLRTLLCDLLPEAMTDIRSRELTLTSQSGKQLLCGAAAYWSPSDTPM